MNKFLLSLTIIFFSAQNVFADINIYCAECKKKILVYQKESLPLDGVYDKADFVSVSKNKKFEKSAEKFICPYDGAPLNGYEYWFWVKGYPAPKMMLSVGTFHVKLKDGKFGWLPSEVELHEHKQK